MRSKDGTDLADLSCLDGCAVDGLLYLTLAVMVLVGIFVWGPAVVAFAAEIVLIVLLSAIAVAAAGLRLLFRRPWRVVALRNWDEVWVWHQVGLGQARQLVQEIRQGFDAGLEPSSMASERLDPASPLSLGVGERSWSEHSLFQWGSRILLLLATVSITVAILASRAS